MQKAEERGRKKEKKTSTPPKQRKIPKENRISKSGSYHSLKGKKKKKKKGVANFRVSSSSTITTCFVFFFFFSSFIRVPQSSDINIDIITGEENKEEKKEIQDNKEKEIRETYNALQSNKTSPLHTQNR